MKPSQLKHFVTGLLTTAGARVEEKSPNLAVIEADGPLAQRLGPSHFALAWSTRGLQEHPASELAVMGNPLFERILDLASERGRVGVRYLPSPPRKKKRPDPPSGNGSLASAEPIASYLPTYYFVFKIEYSLEETPDELEVVAVDGATLEPLAQAPELGEYWESLSREPEAERDPGQPFPLPPAAADAAMQALERRLRKRVTKLRRVSELALEKETENIKQYYEQLIHEARNVGRRWSASTDERSEKIRILQLDWKRRIEDAAQFWHPRVDVELLSVGAVQRAALRFPLKPEGKRSPKSAASAGASLYFDETSGEYVAPRQDGPARADARPSRSNTSAPRKGMRAKAAGAKSPSADATGGD